MSSSIVCSGYINNALIFLAKDQGQFYLHTFGTDGTTNSLSLSNITGYPNTIFDGLCSFSKESSSMYLSFTNTSISTIYQLQLPNYQISPTPITVENSTLSSFSYIIGQNNSQNMAYIANNEQQHMTLNLKSFHSNHSTEKPLSEMGVIAVEGSTLYLIQPKYIEEYRLDHLDYSKSEIETNISLDSICSILTVNETTQYLSIYNPTYSNFDILKHDKLLSNYTKLNIVDGYVQLDQSNATLIKTSTSEFGTPQSSTTSKPTSTDSTPKETNDAKSEIFTATTTTSSSHSQITDISGKNATEKVKGQIRKRGITMEGNSSTSFDGSYTHQRAITSPEDNAPVVMASLTLAESVEQNPPYDIMLLAGDTDQGYHIHTINGSTLGKVSPDARGLSGGAIAGIVIGVLAFIALVIAALWYTKKRKGDRHTVPRNYRSMPIQPNDLETPNMTSVNHSNTSSILQETTYVPDEYRDTSRPDIRPLTYFDEHIKYAELSDSELLALEPDVPGPLYLFSGKYTSSAEEKVTYLRDGYAIRTFEAEDGTKHSIHYFSSANLGTFVQSVYTVLSCNNKETNQQYIMKSTQGIVLCKPTPQFNYQYIWITSPMIPEHSLYYLLFERKTWTFVDHHNPDYKIWSIYAVLKSVETLHQSKFVHLAIDLKSFYYDHETKATDWRLGNFGYAQLSQKNHTPLPPYNAFTAPEIIRHGEGSGEASDIWSLACVIYTIATGGELLFENDIQVKNLITFNDDMKQHLKIAIRDNIENQVFKSLLQDMLQVDPIQRKSITKVLDDWNLVYNMEE